jgi:16S rRNA processing protein RimM
MTLAPNYLLVGEILRPHGVRGELRMRIRTDHPERIGELEQILLGRDIEGKLTPYPVEHLRMHQGYGLLKLKGVDDRDRADTLRGYYVLIDREDAVPLAEDEIYLYQLIGLNVTTDEGELLGTLVDILETGANDVYVIDSPTYGEVLIPDIDETILDIDIAAGTMTVHLLDGLLPTSAQPDE